MNHVALSFINLNHFRWSVLALLTVFLVLSVASGSTDTSTDSPAVVESAVEVDGTLFEVSRIMLPDRSFTADDYVNAGWKLSKQFEEISTVPEATEVYFGFYNARDIELRIYASHDSAASAGADAAAANIEESKEWAARPGAGRAISRFDAFAVIGNTVILCEFSLEVCVELANAVGG
jgi:hypothetical protein